MDTPQTIYTELKNLEGAIHECGNRIKQLSTEADNLNADYELLKNNLLIELFKEESEGGFKRTEKQREAIYRATYSEARLNANLAKNALSAERDYLRALLGNQISVEVRLKLLQQDLEMARRAT